VTAVPSGLSLTPLTIITIKYNINKSEEIQEKKKKGRKE
jgi:hypothetical protein